ncbi:hypothetical protein F0562_034553 [Nyssa sinensis]|uniref:Retrotransposon Copia-like N-terminal domain-containing protein n=1 Tax=Nyssa sinensis TaxID=561372 RepID=A0A5J5AIH9_9ASTE|nr:hypothetical protein F0562_034553 [Nyssa sinensis]
MSNVSIESAAVPPSSSAANSSKSNGTNYESHSIQITTIHLNGDNFLQWSQSVRMYIHGREKMGYLTGEKIALAKDDPAYATWDTKNYMVMTWLMNSMEKDISSNYMFYPLWENVNQMYSDLAVEDSHYHKKIVKDNRILKFLAGLNIEFDEVRGRIIKRQPLPSIGDVFSEVRREESRRNVMQGKKGPGVAVANANSSKVITYQHRNDEKPQVWCDYCNKLCHTRKTCWKIHGKLANWKSSKPGDRSGRAFSTANEVEVNLFTKE